MDTRKIQKTGHSTFTISLPKDWVVRSGLSKGESMKLSLRGDGTMVLNIPGRPRNPREYDMVVDDDIDTLYRKIIGLYISGFTAINFRFGDRDPNRLRSDIKTVLSRITGFEIVEEEADRLVARDLLDYSRYDTVRALERMHKMTRSMLRLSVESMEGDKGRIPDMEDMDHSVNFYNWLIKRHYNLVLYDSSNSETLGIYRDNGSNYVTVSNNLERIADHALNMAKVASGQGPIPPDTAFFQLQEILDRSVKAFLEKDAEVSESVIHSCRELRWVDRVHDGAENAIAWAEVADSFNRIITYIDEIAEIAYRASFMK
ncbi:MAG: PhoU domain-containing protein [Candidatus Thermoplasmatota archaeon]|nr:PhoU domain-containing protein [Candidatus Thermoplasmatota archaeon]